MRYGSFLPQSTQSTQRTNGEFRVLGEHTVALASIVTGNNNRKGRSARARRLFEIELCSLFSDPFSECSERSVVNNPFPAQR
jgi:hypothetical protein